MQNYFGRAQQHKLVIIDRRLFPTIIIVALANRFERQTIIVADEIRRFVKTKSGVAAVLTIYKSKPTRGLLSIHRPPAVSGQPEPLG